MLESLPTVQCEVPEGPSSKLTDISSAVVCDLCHSGSRYLITSLFPLLSPLPFPAP